MFAREWSPTRTQRLRNVPNPSMLVVTMSPSRKKISSTTLMPAGMQAKIKYPRLSVTISDRQVMKYGISKMRSAVLFCWRNSLLTLQFRFYWLGLSRLSTAGNTELIGPNVSNDLLRLNCGGPELNCIGRSNIFCPTHRPATCCQTSARDVSILITNQD